MGTTKLSSSDKKFIEKAAVGGMAEVQFGKLAADKASSDEVKKFGQKMVDDHSKADDQLKQVATSKGVTLPTSLDKSTQREMDKLSKLSGADFDREYMKTMVSDHKKDVSEFKSEASKAKDPDVKQFASSTLPTLAGASDARAVHAEEPPTASRATRPRHRAARARTRQGRDRPRVERGVARAIGAGGRGPGAFRSCRRDAGDIPEPAHRKKTRTL